MRLVRTAHFLRAYHKAPEAIRRAFDRKIMLLFQNLHHPSLRAKKYEEATGLWPGRGTTTGASISRSKAKTTSFMKSSGTRNELNP
jgi:hypothetical protein